jgi:hypothetical protein
VPLTPSIGGRSRGCVLSHLWVPPNLKVVCHHSAMTGLLATVVASRGLQPEPVATDALVHLCSTSVAASAVMVDLLAELCPGGSSDGLVFTGQDIDPSTEGRPDVVAADSMGTRLILEAKFDAELTTAQTSGAYLAKLTTGAPAALVFLVPGDRMQNVWTTISVLLGGAEVPPLLAHAAIDAGIAFASLPVDGHVLAVLSWESLLHRLTASVGKFGDAAGEAELAQIRGLVEWRTRVGWTPLVPGDLPQRAGRQLASLTEIVKSASAAVSSTKTRNGGGDGGPGRYIKTPSGKSLWFGVWFGWWDRFGPGPLWAQAKAKTSQEVALLSEVMTAAGITHYARPQRADVLVPLPLPPGAERSATEAAVMAQLDALIAVVDGAAVEVVEDESTE